MCHPDHHPEDLEAEEKFKQLSEAYSVLKCIRSAGSMTEIMILAFRHQGTVKVLAVMERADSEQAEWDMDTVEDVVVLSETIVFSVSYKRGESMRCF